MSEGKERFNLFDRLKKRDPKRELPPDVTLKTQFGTEILIHPRDFVLDSDQERRFDELFTHKPERQVVVTYFDESNQQRTSSISVVFGHPKDGMEISNIIDQGKVFIYPTYINYVGEDGEKLRSKFPVLAMTVHGANSTDANNISIHKGYVLTPKRTGLVTIRDEKFVPSQDLYHAAQAYLQNQGLSNIALLNSCDTNPQKNNVDYDKRWEQYPSNTNVVMGVGGDANWLDVSTEDKKTVTNVDINRWKRYFEIEDNHKLKIHRYVHSFGKKHPLRPLVDVLFESESPNFLQRLFSKGRRDKHG